MNFLFPFLYLLAFYYPIGASLAEHHSPHRIFVLRSNTSATAAASTSAAAVASTTTTSSASAAGAEAAASSLPSHSHLLPLRSVLFLLSSSRDSMSSLVLRAHRDHKPISMITHPPSPPPTTTAIVPRGVTTVLTATTGRCRRPAVSTKVQFTSTHPLWQTATSLST
eukprot:GHVS01015145.1.p2 GENE.GHVS01015145.1~~GHVS01015145.1.p2  ORF type:complete len:167 (+),score=45.86 GHVS01015145.1:202-702(+)